MFAIQISTFLMTLKLKGIISNDMWHIIYSLSLLLNYIIIPEINDFIFLPLLSIISFIMRYYMNYNKYNMWLILLLIYYIIDYNSYNIRTFLNLHQQQLA